MREVSIIRDTCAKRLSDELEALKTRKASGSKIAGYTCHAFPPAVAAGLGLWPVRMLCGTSSDSESAGERIARADVCPLVKTLLGNVAEKKDLHAEIDLWIGLYTCDQMRRGLNVLAESLGREVHPVQLPSTRSGEAAQYYAAQINRLVSDIQAKHSLAFDEDLAFKWQQARNEASAVLYDAVRSCSISPLDLHAMFHLFFTSRPFGLAEFFRKSISSANKFSPYKTVILTGSPLTLEDTLPLEELQRSGCGLIPLNCTGLNAVESIKRPEADKDLITSLALDSFHLPPCARARPNTVVYDRIADTLAGTGASGIIVKCLKFCDHWYTERERMRNRFDVPVLVFDSDYAAGGRERLLNRVEAFLETL